ncbi:dienelactone hydrolase [Scleroderma yunnanense]
MVCPDCNRGSILPGTPTGSIVKVHGLDAYFAPAPSPSEIDNSSVAVVVLPDAFGLTLVNTKLIADILAKDLACDVWVPDLFNGEPLLRVDGMEVQLIPDRPGRTSLWDTLRLYLVLIPRMGIIIRNRPSVVDARIKSFIKTIREENGYSKIGGVGYCFGGGVAARLAANPNDLDSVVICHPALISLASAKNAKSPTSWVCAEEDSSFPRDMRLKAEAILVKRKDKDDSVSYEFIDYKGTVHGFANRPNLALEEVKAAFEQSLMQTKAWLRKTLEI